MTDWKKEFDELVSSGFTIDEMADFVHSAREEAIRERDGYWMKKIKAAKKRNSRDRKDPDNVDVPDLLFEGVDKALSSLQPKEGEEK